MVQVAKTSRIHVSLFFIFSSIGYLNISKEDKQFVQSI